MTEDIGRQQLFVALLPLPNFTLIAFSAFLDTIRLAADEGDHSQPVRCKWTVLAPELKPVRASCGIEIMPWETLRAPERFDYLVVAGGLLPPAGQALLPTRTRDFIRECVTKGVGVIGICTGSMALVEAGVVPQGSPCCVSWYHHADLVERFPDVDPVADRLWVATGRVITCAGGLASSDLAAHLVKRHLGGAVAQKASHIMLRDGYRPANAAQPQPSNIRPVADPRVRRAILLIEQNLSAPLRVDELAATLAMSRRQMERLFRQAIGASIQVFARDMRLSYAVWLMAERRAEQSGRIDEVALQCGFADVRHFSRQFRKAFGISPSTARQKTPAELHAMLESWWPYGTEGQFPSLRRPPP
ncbi:GlxA family transcriptional regulator [Acidiphilium acidophilum]|uniref:GlxA family transcriptional regulator n=1 Tax=Acidiphilium acidophilum TaxID=76588 RepID=A0AAW9DP30_ACIAO|nr:GlxA family transcriptional regulator [Acidiphilium acidophilum]MDX5930436.1 GlxA family transcriptional regulator [Acidiphilium acidophilum]GBR76943.1 AraC family transcriptional regulator [Acidiphilium acidophilum DSM 700]